MMTAPKRAAGDRPGAQRYSPLRPPDRDGVYWRGLDGASRALAIAAYARRQRAPLIAVCAGSQEAADLENDLRLLADDPTLKIETLPDWETLPYDHFSPDPKIIAARLATLAGLHQLERGVLVVTVAALLQRLPPADYVFGRVLRLAVGERLDSREFTARLVAAGYQAAETVTQPGEFAVRGAVLDLFPSGSPLPCRIELDDDEIASLRSFDPETQRGLERTAGIEMLPAREYPFDRQAIDDFRHAFRNRFDIDVRHCALYQDLRRGYHPPGLEYYLPLFFAETASLADYLPATAAWVRLPGVAAAGERFRQLVAARYEQRRHDLSRPVLEPHELYFVTADIATRTAALPWIEISDEKPAGDSPVLHFASAPPPALPLHQRARDPALALKDYLASGEQRLLIAADSPGRREFLSETLAALGLHPQILDNWHAWMSSGSTFALAVLPLSGGFALPSESLAVITESELFSERQRTARRPPPRDPLSMLRALGELAPGAPVVHEDHGVGRYRGLEVIAIDGLPAEFASLEYRGGDKLYVAISDLHLLSRYSGGDPEQAPWHSLGGEHWAKAKRRARQKISDIAAELLAVHARRAAAAGRAFACDPAAYADFIAAFPYEETADQQSAIDAVLHDLAEPRPMDRVVCGDVGFGKTEVALRAAFTVVHAGAQVALLAPTTLLAQQHYNVFRDRFADWPVRIELFSRASAASGSAIQRDLQAGKIDIVIGTHRLLQRHVAFADLGLLIVDEEQRFGVEQKEKLKSRRADVDLLTLTATPIPRTLNMTLGGLRDISIIATPPARRNPIRTAIAAFEPDLIRDAVNREVQRGGQVYFVHNEVQSLPRIRRELHHLLPEVDIAVAHGQMGARELERTMREFYARRHELLLCTTIIENGIDVANANTIIINRADRFGLAQLHQLRGRVGRSYHQAYAYLLVPDWRAITADARKRLEAISSLTELGAGFMLASHDLEIRGAGELLGAEQSGHIQEIGYSLYMEMLSRTVTALKAGGDAADLPAEPAAIKVELHIPALIPDDYLSDVSERLILYRRLAGAAGEELTALESEMIDRFGRLPEAAGNLFRLAALRQQCSALGIRHLELGSEGGIVEFGDRPGIDVGRLVEWVQSEPERYRLRGDRLAISQPLPDAAARFTAARELLEMLHPTP